MEAVTTTTFDDVVLAAEQPVLVDFWGPQCAPCLALEPGLEALSEEFAGKVKFVKVNARENPRLCIRLKVSGLPAIVLFHRGEEVARVSGGDVTIADIRQMIEEHVAAKSA